jgi:ATP/maltotriose-dependent transcriptional regulator MalT
MNDTQRIRATDAAICVCPGITAAKLRGDREGALILLQDYKAQARAMGISDADVWACLAAASLIWLEAGVSQVADSEQRSAEDVLREMSLRTAQARA